MTFFDFKIWLLNHGMMFKVCKFILHAIWKLFLFGNFFVWELFWSEAFFKLKAFYLKVFLFERLFILKVFLSWKLFYFETFLYYMEMSKTCLLIKSLQFWKTWIYGFVLVKKLSKLDDAIKRYKYFLLKILWQQKNN